MLTLNISIMFSQILLMVNVAKSCLQKWNNLLLLFEITFLKITIHFQLSHSKCSINHMFVTPKFPLNQIYFSYLTCAALNFPATWGVLTIYISLK